MLLARVDRLGIIGSTFITQAMGPKVSSRIIIHRPPGNRIEHRQRVEVAAEVITLDRRSRAPSATAAGQLFFDVGFLATVDHRPDLGAIVTAIADLASGSLASSHETVFWNCIERPWLLDIDAFGADTHLAGVAEGVRRGELCCSVEIGIVEDDQWILSPQFQDDTLETAAGTFEDVCPGRAGAGEGDEVDIGLPPVP